MGSKHRTPPSTSSGQDILSANFPDNATYRAENAPQLAALHCLEAAVSEALASEGITGRVLEPRLRAQGYHGGRVEDIKVDVARPAPVSYFGFTFWTSNSLEFTAAIQVVMSPRAGITTDGLRFTGPTPPSDEVKRKIEETYLQSVRELKIFQYDFSRRKTASQL